MLRPGSSSRRVRQVEPRREPDRAVVRCMAGQAGPAERRVVGAPLRPSRLGRWGSHRWTTADGDAPCPGATRTIATTDGRTAGAPVLHRRAPRGCPAGPPGGAADRAARTVRTPLADALPWLREPAETGAARAGDSDGPDRRTRSGRAPRRATPAPAALDGPRDRRRPPGPRGRRWRCSASPASSPGGTRRPTTPEPEPCARARPGDAPEGATADAWAQRATVALTSVNRELDVLAQADEEWRRLPESRRAVVPPPVAALEERRSVLQRRRTTLQSQLDAYRSLRRAQQELAVSEQHLRAVEKALVDAPPERRRSAEQEAAIAALDEQRDLRLRRRDAQRAELASLQDGVSTATRTPLPDDGEATAKVSRGRPRDGPQRRDRTLPAGRSEPSAAGGRGRPRGGGRQAPRRGGHERPAGPAGTARRERGAAGRPGGARRAGTRVRARGGPGRRSWSDGGSRRSAGRSGHRWSARPRPQVGACSVTRRAVGGERRGHVAGRAGRTAGSRGAGGARGPEGGGGAHSRASSGGPRRGAGERRRQRHPDGDVGLAGAGSAGRRGPRSGAVADAPAVGCRW